MWTNHKLILLSFNFVKYLKQLVPSFFIMLTIAYGMAVGNTLIQYGGLILVLGGQMGWQLYKGMKSGPLMDANMKEANRAKRLRILQTVSDKDVQTARMAGGLSGQMMQNAGMLGMLIVPLAVFFGTSYVIGMVWPGTEAWKSYMTGFLLSMPVSLIFMRRSGMQAGGAPQTTPTSYVVTEQGIVFDQMGKSLIVKFPIKKAEKGKQGNCVEVEGIKEADLIPYKLKLYTDNADDLLRILNQRMKKDVAA